VAADESVSWVVVDEDLKEAGVAIVSPPPRPEACSTGTTTS